MSDKPIELKASDNVVSLGRNRAPQPTDQPADPQVEGDGVCYESLADVATSAEFMLERLESGLLTRKQWRRTLRLRNEAIGRLFLCSVDNEIDAMAAIRVVLLNIIRDAEETASTPNALAYHMLGQVSTFLHKRSLRRT